MIEDAGSRFGVTVSGQPLSEPRGCSPAQEIRLGNVVLRVESALPRAPALRRGRLHVGVGGDANPNATIVVPVGATEMGLRAPAPMASRDGSLRPRLRSGWALKRLDDESDEERYVLRDLRGGTFLRMSERGRAAGGAARRQADRRGAARRGDDGSGPAGAGRLARLMADFGERGMLDGVAPTPRAQDEPGFFARAFKPREQTVRLDPASTSRRAYRHWGRLFFSPLMVTCLVLLSLAGLVVFSYLVGARYGTPFVVAHRLRASAASCSSAGGSRSSSCTSSRTGSRSRTTDARPTAPGSG